MNFLAVTFWLLGVGIFLFGLVGNYGEALFPPVVLYLFRYGRANITKTKVKFDAVKKLEVPKSWFTHFYLYAVIVQAWIFYIVLKTYEILQTTATQDQLSGSSYLASILGLLGGDHRSQTVDATTTALVTGMFLFQVCRRLYESAFVSIYSGTKMNIFHYVLAFVHYSGSMLSLIAHSPRFSGLGTSISETDLRVSWENSTSFHAIGIALFLYASVQQHKVHVGFANLRKVGSKIVSYSYQIPRGGLFELVSCPNYWAEILIYTALTIVTGFQNPSWNAVTAWVICNQITSGVMNHIWYQRTFSDYPKHRRAVIPYIW